MRLPLRLTAALLKARIALPSRGSDGASLFHLLDPADVLHPDSPHPISHEKLRGIPSSKRLVWIRGSEPLSHPGVAHLVRAVAPGRFIFLETDGVALRRRIHEFPPLPQLMFVVRLEVCPAVKPTDSRTPSALTLALEGLRTAQLSGFWTAIDSAISGDSNLEAIREHQDRALRLKIDGWLVTAATATPAALRKAAEARALIPSARWRGLSEEVEHAALGRLEGISTPAVAESVDHATPVFPSVASEAREESARAS